METEFLADIIKEVLVSSGKACLPGFGAFRTEHVPAYFSDKGFTVNPPYLKLVFDAGIKDDTALVDFYAANNGLTLSRASDVIAGKVSALRQELMASRAVLLPGLGYLRVTHDGSFFFVAGENLEVFPFYDMLEPVSLRYLPVTASANVPDDTDASVFADAPFPEEAMEPQESGAYGNNDAMQDVEEHTDAGTPADGFTAADGKAPAGETAAECQVQNPGAGNAAGASKTRRHVLAAVLIAVSLAVLALAALAVLGRTCPELVDPLLYSDEELQILYTVL